MKNPVLGSLAKLDKREFFFNARKNDQSSYRAYYVTGQERKLLINECNESCLLLYEYYLSLVSKTTKDEISDKAAAHYFGWDISKVKRTRLLLVKTKWFRAESFTYSSGRKGTTYYLGKDEVAKSYPPNTAAFKSP